MYEHITLILSLRVIYATLMNTHSLSPMAQGSEMSQVAVLQKMCGLLQWEIELLSAYVMSNSADEQNATMFSD